jgi:ribonucleoside-diphosphate reductase alpha subunit
MEKSSTEHTDMYVIKRNGKKEIVSFDKILKRIRASGSGIKINYTNAAMKVIDQLYDGISTTKIDELSAEQCAYMCSTNPDYNILAANIIISNHQKHTSSSFYKTMSSLYKYKNKAGKYNPLIAEDVFNIIQKNNHFFDSLCDYSRDFLIDYFGFKTLERSYLMKINGKVVERPQHLWLRVAIGIHKDNLEKVQETYEYLSKKYMTHATPTLFNAGTPHPQLSSCFLISMEDDSIEGIFNTLKDCALISKWAGGIGMHIHNVRGYGSRIYGTNGTSNGIVPMLKVFNNTAKYVDQCLHENTVVFTKRGPIPIKNIIIGDKVITDDGKYHKVGKILDYPNTEEPLYSIAIKSSLKPIILTYMHPLWVKQDEYSPPDFIEAKNINVGNLIGFPIPTYEKEIIQITEEDCRMYGILLAECTISSQKVSGIFHCVNQKETIDFIHYYLLKINIKPTTTYLNEAIIKLSWKKNNMFKFTKEMTMNLEQEDFLHIFKTKINPVITEQNTLLSKIIHLPKRKIIHFIKGFICTNNLDFLQNEYEQLNEWEYLYFLEYMLLRFGLFLSKENLFLLSKFGEKEIEENNERLSNYIFSEVIENTLLLKNDSLTRVMDIEIEDEKHRNFLTSHGLVKNGGGKRNGSIAIYLEPWHSDIENFLQMRKNHGDEEMKARDLFYALWISDLFMERVKAGSHWTLMCPDECPGLSDVYGEEFNELYLKYEEEQRGKKTINARDLWFQILDAQMETGTPYLLYKDSVNKKSNQKNIGIIKSSNLCCEIVQYSDSKETSVCNLASISLPAFIEKNTETETMFFNYENLHKVVRTTTNNLNKIIDVNYYPTEKCKNSNFRHRPIGIGVQGLADIFIMLDLPFTSTEAKLINLQIFETIYHAALEESCSLSQQFGAYETFDGSPASCGILQFDMWKKEHPDSIAHTYNYMYNWEELKQRIVKHGLRNSLLIAPMPTASTSQILGNNECIEPITSNIYTRRTNAGDFILANKYLIKDLMKLNLWNEKIKNNIILNNGSIQQIEIIPQHIRNKYKTVWEIPMRELIDMSADRAIFVCQSQSLNLWIEEPNYSNLTSMHFYAWSKGLKTGQYYLRRRATAKPQQFSIEPEIQNAKNGNVFYDNEVCENCSA